MAALGAACAGAGCDVARPDPDPVGPVMHVVSGLDASGKAHIEATFPDPANAAGSLWAKVDPAEPLPVPVNAAFSVRFDRYLLPVNASRQSICIQSSLVEIKSLEECTGLVFTNPSYDPVERRVIYRPSALEPDTLYQITLFSAAEGGFRAFDGAALSFDGLSSSATSWTTRFKTDPAGAKVGALPGEVGGKHCEAELTLLCRCGSCHGAAGPAMGLDLVGGLGSTAVNQFAHQTLLGGDAASKPAANPPKFGVSMARVRAEDPGNSYLLYKILVNPASQAWDPTLAKGETDRLRRSVVSGMAMPAQPSPALSQSEALSVSQWIAAGADVAGCPPPSAADCSK